MMVQSFLLKSSLDTRRACALGLLAAGLALCMMAGAGDVAPVTIVEIALTDAEVDALSSAGFDIANFRGNIATIYATDAELESLEARGYAYEIVGRQPDPPLFTPGAKGLGVYHSYAALTTEMEAYATAHPAICRLSSLGQSVQGRELWALLITDFPDSDEDEPEVKYVSTMHGDEPLGTELCLYLVDRLLTDYGVDGRITDLVDETAIWIVPLMNPDGLEAGWRYNANGKDLNRNFPRYPEDFLATAFDGEALGDAGLEPEIQHVMRWTNDHRFVISGNLHTGALLVNYPYDDDGVPSGSDAPTPDDLLFEEVSLCYARNNPALWNDSPFTNGISNGTAWFSIDGGMQDWNYRYAACNEVTLELSAIKRPAELQLPAHWADNEESMLVYMEAAHIGVRGLVTDAAKGAPLWAKVAVEGNAQAVFTDPEVGDYHRMLLPGTYALTFSADGYEDETVADIVVVDGPATRVDVALTPNAPHPADVNGDGTVNALDVQAVINEALGISTGFDGDVNGDGAANALDVQAVVNAALGV